MPQYGVSESGIDCKVSENNDKLYVFRGLFNGCIKYLTVRHTKKQDKSATHAALLLTIES